MHNRRQSWYWNSRLYQVRKSLSQRVIIKVSHTGEANRSTHKITMELLLKIDNDMRLCMKLNEADKVAAG